MIALPDWFPPALVGATFTTLGFLKVYAIKKGLVGGGGKSLICRLRGSCPSWSRRLNIIFAGVLLTIGLGSLGFLLTILLAT
jgi:hypothetical protein